MAEGDLTDQASCPQSSGSDPQTVISDTVVQVKVATHHSPHSPTSRHNPFNEDSDTNTTNTSADVTPVHVANYRNSTTNGDDAEPTSNELEVIRCSSDGVSSFVRFHLQWQKAQLTTVFFQDGQKKKTSQKATWQGLHRFQQ